MGRVAILKSRLAFGLSNWADDNAFVEIEKPNRGREEVWLGGIFQGPCLLEMVIFCLPRHRVSS